MALSPRQKWSYPNENQDPWWPAYQAQINAQDASVYSLREDKNAVLMGGGTFTFDATGSTLDWSDTIELLAAPTGRLWQAPAGVVSMTEGSILFVTLPRAPIQNTGISIGVTNALPDVLMDDRLVIGVRRNDRVYFRNGSVLGDGESLPILESNISDSIDAYERTGTFGIPVGDSGVESTYGRVMFPGSLVGVSAEINKDVTGGTITVDVKVNGAVKLTVQLDTSSPTFAQATVTGGTHPVAAGDQISVEYTASGYANVGSLDAGLTVNVCLVSGGVAVNLASVSDASASQKGVTLLSVDPAVATAPIAYAQNDPGVPRTDSINVFTRALGSQTYTLVDAPVVSINAGLSNAFELEITATRQLGNPINLQDGFSYKFRIINGGPGGWTLTYDSAWKFPGGILPNFSTAPGPGTAGAVSYIYAESDGTYLYCRYELDIK